MRWPNFGQTQHYEPKVLAVTGTNGKTTVTRSRTTWSSGRQARRHGGNIGPALLDTLAQALDAQSLPEVWVLGLQFSG